MTRILVAILAVFMLAAVGLAQGGQFPSCDGLDKKAFKACEKEARKAPLKIRVPNTTPAAVKAAIGHGMLSFADFHMLNETSISLSFIGSAKGSQAFAYGLGAAMSGRQPDQLKMVVTYEILPNQDGSVDVQASCAVEERSALGSNVQSSVGCSDKGTRAGIIDTLKGLVPADK